MRVAVVGGGVAGLTAAAELGGIGADVTVFEAAATLGGQIRTEWTNGFLVEHGAEGFSVRSTSTLALCDSLELAPDLLPQQQRVTLLLREGQFEELAEGAAGRLLGIQADPDAFGAGLVTLRNGLGDLITSLTHRLTGTCCVHRNTAITRLVRDKDTWRLEGGSTVEWADAVILALPAEPTRRLLEPLIGPLPVLRDLPHLSSVCVSMGFARSAVRHPLDATGFVLPPSAPGACRACTFSSSKFTGRAPKETVLLRAFLRIDLAESDSSDATWLDVALRSIGPALGITARPLFARVTRWPAALPRHPAGFQEVLAGAIDRAPVHLAGAGITGGGVEGAVRSGLAAASTLAPEVASSSWLANPPTAR